MLQTFNSPKPYSCMIQIPNYDFSFTHLNNLSGDFLFAKPIDDDVGRHPGHTQHPALGAPGQGLDGKRVLLYYFCVCFLLLATSLLKHLGSLQLIQHLKHYFEKRRDNKQKRGIYCLRFTGTGIVN